MKDMQRFLLTCMISLILGDLAHAQDTLPRFSVTVKGANKILISWHNGYPQTSQISIQRSLDSLKNYSTLLTVPDPNLPENGVMDTRADHPNYYYRLFIVLSEGKYLFTPSKRPRASAPSPQQTAASREDLIETDPVLSRADHQRVLVVVPDKSRNRPEIKNPTALSGRLPDIEVEHTVYIRKGDTIIGKVAGPRLRNFRDSLLTRTKDTLVFIDGDTLLIRPFVPKEVYRVSPYVFTGKYGNVNIVLPEAIRKRFTIKFYDDTNKLLFVVDSIKTTTLIIDKSNFQHAGWFRFELFENDQLKEKNRIFIPKEF